jgi:5-methylcytosine-specific restriction endonuclease McrA
VVEHLIPTHRGGTAAPENLTIACSACNRVKGSRTAEEWGFATVPTWANPTAFTVRWSDPEMDYQGLL